MLAVVNTRLAVAALAVATLATTRTPQTSDATTIGWLAMFNPPLVEWLENENRLAELCAGRGQGSPELDQCRTMKLAPRVHTARLWHGPSDRSQPAGSLVIVATPGKGLQCFYVPAAGGARTEFRPDLFDRDWGYGPYFHISFLERRGSWFRLPRDPFQPNTWVDATELGGADVRTLDSGEIVTSPFGDLYVIGIDREGIRVRPEQESDMWCGDRPPPLKPFKERRILIRDLYSPTGHLLLHIKYTRGC